MIFFWIMLSISLIISILGFIFRKTLGVVFKIMPFALVSVLAICLIRGIPVASRVYEYMELAKTDISELENNYGKCKDYVQRAQELNEWISEYQETIKNHPTFAFFKDKVMSFTQIDLSEFDLDKLGLSDDKSKENKSDSE